MFILYSCLIFNFSSLIFNFPHVSPWAVGQQQDGHDDAHEEQHRHIEPQCLDVPGADNLLTAVERRTSHLVARRQEDDAGTGNDGRAYHFDGTALVSADDAVFQLQVVVVALEL